jgi:ferredoxin-thioredoxin reductase catalytic subunit
VKYLKIEVLELPVEKVALLENAYGLASCPNPHNSDVREEILQRICSENPEIKAQIDKFRRENQ